MARMNGQENWADSWVQTPDCDPDRLMAIGLGAIAPESPTSHCPVSKPAAFARLKIQRCFSAIVFWRKSSVVSHPDRGVP